MRKIETFVPAQVGNWASLRVVRESDLRLLLRVARAADKWRTNDDGKEFELVDAVDALNAKAKR